MAAFFDKNYYLQSKLAQLQNSGETQYANVLQVQNAILAAGMTVQEHFEKYSLVEETSPNKYFNTTEYLEAKVAQLNAAKEQDKDDWTVSELLIALNDAGYTNAYDHYVQYGWDEGVNPSNAFDTDAYLESKLAELKADEATKEKWADKTVDDLKQAFKENNIDPISHYEEYGKTEGVTVTEVPDDEKVDPAESTGQTYTLTTGIDDLTGTSGDDTFIAGSVGATSTLNAGDQIDGAGGTDTLKLYAAANAGNFASAVIKNVEVVENNAASNLDVSGNADVTQAWAMADGFTTTATLSQTVGLADATGTGAAGSNVVTFIGATGSADAATIAVKDAGKTTAYADVTVAAIENLAIEAEGKNQLGNLIAAAAEDITITGSGSLKATLAPGAATVLKTVTATENTGGVTLGLTDAQFGTNDIAVATGKGNDTIAFTDAFGAKASIDLGEGKNTLAITQGATALTAGSTFKAGSGTSDTLVLNATTTSIDATTGKMFTGFENIKLAGALVTDTSSYKVGDIAGITGYEMSTGVHTLTNAADGISVKLTAKAGEAETITLADNSLATSSVSVSLDNGATVAAAGADVDLVTNAHVVNVASDGLTLATVGNHNELTFSGTSLAQITNITAKGDQALDITTGIATALTLVDGSEATGKLLITATGATKAMVIKGGSADDTIVTNDVAGTKVYGNDGADSITLTAAGNGEIVAYTAQADSTATAFDSLAGFRTADGDKIDLKDFGFTGTADDAVTLKTTGITVTAKTVDVTTAAAADFFADATAVDRAVAVYDDGTDSWAFVDVNKDGNYSADDDMVIKIVGGADGASGVAAIGDFVFA